MMFKTHIVAAFFVILFLLPTVNYKISFIIVLLIAALLPDADIANSYMGKRWYFRPLQLFVTHRGVIHSFTLCLSISVLFAYFIPVFALPFFLGYSLHLFLDSLTSEGIRPFWPMKQEVEGNIRVGGRLEEIVFLVIVFLDILLLIKIFT